MTIMDFAKVGLPHVVKRVAPFDDVVIAHRTKRGKVQIRLKSDLKTRLWVEPTALKFLTSK
jgi:hypothetical protein